tara:strand:+ start:476 stop:586 length:111 start_codon:yes stop_codon:yes gene_type:complete
MKNKGKIRAWIGDIMGATALVALIYIIINVAFILGG